MLRRTFLATATAAIMLPLAATAAGNMINYKPGLIQQKLAAGKVVFVDYKASWCGTCAAQERVINALRNENPAYNAAMTFVAVDWDDYGNHEVTKSRNIPRRSTLLVLKGNKELGRIVAGTGRAQIKALMDKGRAAGS